MTGPELASRMEVAERSILGNVDHALTGCNLLTRTEARELSQPGSETVLQKESSETLGMFFGSILASIRGFSYRSFSTPGPMSHMCQDVPGPAL